MLTLNKKLPALLTVFLCVLSFNVFAVSDSDVAAMVKKQLGANKTTANSKITVEVKNGLVFLSGNVQTEGEASSAIEEASSIVGVKDVNSDALTVKNGTQPYTDSYITAKIKGAFIREKLFGDQPMDVTGIKVETKDGVVYLTGTAATKAQADAAVSLSKAINGVRAVESKVVIQQA